jgi:hypothetical protein
VTRGALVGVLALVAMFLLPYLDARGLLDGPHTIRHRPRRHVCAGCGGPWTAEHVCLPIIVSIARPGPDAESSPSALGALPPAGRSKPIEDGH